MTAVVDMSMPAIALHLRMHARADAASALHALQMHALAARGRGGDIERAATDLRKLSGV